MLQDALQPDALVFDLDGTLWDAAAASAYGWNLALEELDLPQRVTVEGIRSVSGRPFPECAARLLPELMPIPPATLELLEERERTGIGLLPGDLYPGVAEVLPRLAQRYPLFLVSNCPGWYLEAFFGHSGLQGCFTGWDCWGMSGVSKAAMLTTLAEKYHLEQAVYLGDTQTDRAATEAAGMTFAFAEYGFGQVDSPPLSFKDFAALERLFMA